MELEGTLDIFRPGPFTDPSSCLYKVGLIPYETSGGRYLSPDCLGDAELIEFLRALGIHEDLIEEAVETLHELNNYEIPNVRVSVEQLEALGFRIEAG